MSSSLIMIPATCTPSVITPPTTRCMIIVMRSHIGIPELLAVMGLSILVFKPKWEACIKAGPRSMLFAAALIIGLFALAIVTH